MRGLRIDRLTPPPRRLTTSAGAVLAARCHLARTPLARLVGLLATPDLTEDEAVWLEPCRSVHSGGLRAAIGCAFLDGAGRVIRVVDPLPRWRVRGQRAARVVVECRAGVLAPLRPGDRLVLASGVPGDRCRSRGVIRAPLAPRAPDGHGITGAGPATGEER